MSKPSRSFRRVSTVLAAVAITAVISLSAVAATSNAATFSFIDSVREFFGVQAAQIAVLTWAK